MCDPQCPGKTPSMGDTLESPATDPTGQDDQLATILRQSKQSRMLGDSQTSPECSRQMSIGESISQSWQYSAKSNRNYAIIQITKYQGLLGNHAACIHTLSRHATPFITQGSEFWPLHTNCKTSLFILLQARVQYLRPIRRLLQHRLQHLPQLGGSPLPPAPPWEPTGGLGRW